MTATKPPRPPDPRVERSRTVILHATVEELAATGYGAFAIESVATRAGVAKTTIYRHWPGKVDLIIDALSSFHEQMVPSLHDATAHEQVERLLRHVAQVLQDSTFSRCIAALVEGAQRDPRLRALLHGYAAQRRRELADVIAQGIHGGELSAGLDPDLVAVTLLGPIFYLGLMSARPFAPQRASDLVRTVLGIPPATTASRPRRRRHP
ncbi:MAG TPA: TetR/AcrR family transcriptional regulator [Rugosimonospora sp.]|nr:TetR/AcrR family transcriptional regulator [Rugosimonospora sp.]